MPTYAATGSVTINGSYEDSSNTTTAQELISYQASKALTSGTGASNADLFYSTRAQHTSTTSYDLTGGLTDRFGNTLTFVELREILVFNRSTTAGEILVLQGNLMSAFLNGTAPTADLGPEGWFYHTNPRDGFTVTGTTQDTLTIDAGANTISYDLFLIGTSA